MTKLNTDITDYLRMYAEKINDGKASAKRIMESYQPQAAVEQISKIIKAIKPDQERYANAINRLAEQEIKKITEAHQNRMISQEHQMAVSNILKLLELSNYEVPEGELENLLAPLVNANNYSVLRMLSDIFSKKGQTHASNYCLEKSQNNEIENVEKMMDAIKQYINTNIIIAIGGDPIKFKYSSYEEIYDLMNDLGFDTKGLDTELYGNNSLIDMDYFLSSKMAANMGLQIEKPLFKNIPDEGLPSLSAINITG